MADFAQQHIIVRRRIAGAYDAPRRRLCRGAAWRGLATAAVADDAVIRIG
jgi:hypothetical protein